MGLAVQGLPWSPSTPTHPIAYEQGTRVAQTALVRSTQSTIYLGGSRGLLPL